MDDFLELGQFLLIALEDKDFNTPNVVLEETDTGFRVDWECWVTYSTMDWNQFVAERPNTPQQFRVGFMLDDYFNFDFSDPTKFLCLKFHVPESETTLWGYVRLDSPVTHKLRAILAEHTNQQETGGAGFLTTHGDLTTTGAFDSYGIFELKFPENPTPAANGSQVEITDFLTMGWVSDYAALSTATAKAQNPAQIAAAKMTVPDGFYIDPIAAEPEVVQPIAFTIDERGRLWVVEGHTYPQRAPEGEGNDRILIFEDGDFNGSFETRKVFM
ncbi:MAG: hypothetical protein O3C21_20685, partial [Verrucomicrobia bacterium]|nr:hypothetical protein [Verrucomicrobiota bacterium]